MQEVRQSALGPRLGLKKLLLASDRDRAILQSSNVAHLVDYLASDDGSFDMLKDSFPIAAVAFSDKGETDLKKGLARLSALRTVPELAVLRLDPANVAESSALLRALAEDGIGRLARYTSSITSELAMLRREREELFENYRLLEDAFHARNWEPVAEVFAHDPFADPKDEGVGQLLSSAFIEQLLPVSSLGVAGFALHFHSLPKGTGELIVGLSYLESGEGIAEWNVPYVGLATGWNFFSLPRACGGAARTLRLRVSASGSDALGLSLGHHIASERYSARSEHPHPDLDLRPLAFRVFTGLPGVKPASTANMIAPTSLLEGQFTIDYRLGLEKLSQIADVSVTQIVPDFQTIRFLDHEHAIVCHPLASGISAGAINRAIEPGTVSLSASAIIDHPKGAPAAVSFLLSPASSNARAEVAELARKGTVKPSTLFSGWREVGAQQSISISMQMDEAIRVPMDLIILSRAAGDSVDFCWLKVSSFRLVKQSTEALDVR